jgi:hypothetical protein
VLGATSPYENKFIISIIPLVDFLFLPSFEFINPPIFAVMAMCVDDSQGIMLA